MPTFPNIFGPDDEIIPCPWRAEIASVEDDQERFRYRVRLLHFHDESIPVERLPFAELIGYGGKGFGDLGPYEVGDLVWCMFEGGNREYPVILGGWLSQSAGIPDLLPEQQNDYSTNRRRWMRKGRPPGANLIEMSDVPGEDRVRIKSGRAEIVLTRLDNGIAIKAIDGPVTLDAARVTVRSAELQLEGGNTTVLANGQIPPVDPTEAIPTPGVPSGTAQLLSNNAVNIYGGAIPGTDLLGLVRIGQYVDAALVQRQSGIVRINPQLLELGNSQTAPGLLPTLFVDAAATTRVRVLAPSVVVGVEAVADFLVKFTQLKTEFDIHTHGGVTSGAASTTPPAVPLSAAVSTANVRAS